MRTHERASDEFTVTHRGDKIRVRADSARAATTWVRDIEKAREACLDAVAKSRQRF